MPRLVLVTFMALLSLGAFRPVQAQGLPGADECRTYTEKVSKETLVELGRQQESFIKFRSRQFAENAPPQRIDETQTIISDYKQAIDLTQQTLDGKLTQPAWRVALEPLQLLPPCDTAELTQTGDGALSQKTIGLAMILVVAGGAVVAVVYRKRASGK